VVDMYSSNFAWIVFAQEMQKDNRIDAATKGNDNFFVD